MKKLKLSIALISLCILCACNNKIDDKMQDSTGIQPMTEVNDEGEVIITRGRCGEQANWTYYEETGLLEIYGKGPLWGDIYPDDYTRLRDKNGKILDYPYLAYDRDGVKSIIVAEGITMLPTDIFSNYKSLQEVTIGNDVDFAGGGSFSYCRNLKKVLLPDSMENVLYGMFEGCESLESINIPENARVIYGNAFFGCTALKEIELSDSVRIIEDFAFYGCNNMEKIKMSENIWKHYL